MKIMQFLFLMNILALADLCKTYKYETITLFTMSLVAIVNSIIQTCAQAPPMASLNCLSVKTCLVEVKRQRGLLMINEYLPKELPLNGRLEISMKLKCFKKKVTV